MRSTIVLLSGGLDSTVALADTLVHSPVAAALTFDYGSKHALREIACARRQAQTMGVKHIVIPLAFIGTYFSSALLAGGEEIPEGSYDAENMSRTVVPFRNGIMLSVAVGLAESLDAKGVVIAAHAGDHVIYADCRPAFLDAFAETASLGTDSHIEILRPFVHLDKAEIVARGIALGVDFSHTWSCYRGGETPCGNCSTCIERKEAFVKNGIDDPGIP